MKKLNLLLAVVFIAASSFTVNDFTDCDALAADWYYQTLAGGYGQSTATHVHDQVLITCVGNGGSSSQTLHL